ncbi:MAG TPA: UTP--glucose-1-phosphate uridylyltransferase [Bryobacteraceae bacterium]|nr:UTP--glucose-1-phosphate uridylyltransferase [Bryobacteraceae bacterium]
MSELISIIVSQDPEARNRALDGICNGLSTHQLMQECAALDRFWRSSGNLYERVRAQFFLFSIYRFHLPFRTEVGGSGLISFEATNYLLKRRFEEAIECLLRSSATAGMNATIASGLAAAYRGLGFKTLADQVRLSVRSVRGNQWMSRIGHPEDYPLTLRQELLGESPYPILREATPVRMDLTHSAWSDIFFLGMDFPEGARVLNVSIDLSIHGNGPAHPSPPVESYFRVIGEPVLRLTSVDLNDTTDITSFAELFDFARDNLGLLKAAIIASGIVPPAMEGATQPLRTLLSRLAGEGKGIELVSRVRDIPKGSRLAVSTNLLAGLISVCMRATSQIKNLTGMLEEKDRRLVAARAILGEWIGGSGGGWQDSGGVWPGMKVIEGAEAREGDPEFGVSRGRLLPSHRVIHSDEISERTRRLLQESLVLVHGGMAQDVGPILEMVTEKYLLRSESEWGARQEAIQILDRILIGLRHGDIRSVGAATEQNFFGPIQAIVPWTSNRYTEILIERARAEMGSDFWGFWMLGGMAGGGMGFIFSPEKKRHAQARMQKIMLETKQQLEHAVPFAMDPVVYDFAINERGTFAELLSGDASLMPEVYYTFVIPRLLRMASSEIPAYRRAELDRFASACRTVPELSGVVQGLFDRLLPSLTQEKDGPAKSLKDLLEEYGFDPVAHEQIRLDLRNGRIGLAQNRLPSRTRVEDAQASDVFEGRDQGAIRERFRATGMAALAGGKAAILSLAGGAGSRWTKGAGVVKALNPFCKFHGRHRSFIEVHLAKTRRTSRLCGVQIPHIITTSYLTHAPMEKQLAEAGGYGYDGPVLLSPGRSIGLRLVPMVRDLHFAWNEMPQQLLDAQKQKVRDSGRSALTNWALQSGEASDYVDNLPMQCLHPTGHWYEVSNILRNGVLAELLRSRPQLKYLMVHNIDTLGADVDAGLLGYHIEQKAGLTFEVITRNVDDRGGGLARVDGRLRLIEGMALPSEEIESALTYYNSNTSWVDIDRLLETFALSREALMDAGKVAEAVRTLAARMPTFVTLKDVKKRWGKGQEDIFPVAQFEKLFVDMTALPELDTRFVVVSRQRGQQLKEPAQLDGWFRDGSVQYVESLCDWE